uniref:Uncharacterized protein n=1 Tax=Anopheles culicifacies TaxID=139723 RepID=A0A182MGS9_9DIPT
MIRNESLVTADVSWSATLSDICNGTNFGVPGANQCLVTWEVSGGGLMGNLLTESSSVQLSLWSDTNYRVQVTCRSKHTSSLIRSAPLVLSTAGATTLESARKPVLPNVTASTVELLSEIAEGDDDEALARELDSSEDLARDGHHKRPPGQLHPWPIARESESEIAILALFVAMLLFLLVLLTIVILVKWRPAGPGEPDRHEKDVLVENDVMVEILHV